MKFQFVLVLAFVYVFNYQIECQINIEKLIKKFDSLDLPFRSKQLTFSYQNCGPDSDPFRILSLNVTPDPVKLPGNITFSGEAQFKQNVSSPLTMSLKLIKQVGPFKVEIPCVDNFGSCTYSDVCAMLPSPSDCPAFFKEHSIPCTCPFPAGDYKGDNITVEIDTPAKIPSGEYILQANFVSKTIGHVGCVEIQINAA